MGDLYLIFWVIPSLVTCLLLIQLSRRCEGQPPQSWKSSEWIFLGVLSLLYPIGLFLIHYECVWPFLVKERRWFWND